MESLGKMTVTCERVEAIVLDLDRENVTDFAERAAAIAHLAHCPHCAGLQESWQAAREELRALGEETLAARAPARVEMRLRQEFRIRHRTRIMRQTAAAAAWVLAAAAVLVGAVSVWNWERLRRLDAIREAAAREAQRQSVAATSAGISGLDDSGEFTPLPGSTLDDTDEAAILHVRMQRGSLAALGLPVNEQRAADWIQVDMLVGNDGLPQAVRLAQEED